MPRPMKLVPGDWKMVAVTVMQQAAMKNSVVTGWSGLDLLYSAAPVSAKKMKTSSSRMRWKKENPVVSGITDMIP